MAKAANKKNETTAKPKSNAVDKLVSEKTTIQNTPSKSTADGDDGDIKTPPAEPVNNGDEKSKKNSSELEFKMKAYVKAYPSNKIFYITTDGNVFLEANKQHAHDHEKTLGNDGVVSTYSI